MWTTPGTLKCLNEYIKSKASYFISFWRKIVNNITVCFLLFVLPLLPLSSPPPPPPCPPSVSSPSLRMTSGGRGAWSTVGPPSWRPGWCVLSPARLESTHSSMSSVTLPSFSFLSGFTALVFSLISCPCCPPSFFISLLHPPQLWKLSPPFLPSFSSLLFPLFSPHFPWNDAWLAELWSVAAAEISCSHTKF